MAIRVLIAGRQAWASSEWRSLQAQRAKPDTSMLALEVGHSASESSERASTPSAPLPLLEPPTRSAGSWRDPRDGVLCRVITRFDPSQGWVLSATVMAWYEVDYAAVCSLVQRGLIEAAVEVSHVTKRFRVLDTDRVLAYLAHPLGNGVGARPAVTHATSASGTSKGGRKARKV